MFIIQPWWLGVECLLHKKHDSVPVDQSPLGARYCLYRQWIRCLKCVLITNINEKYKFLSFPQIVSSFYLGLKAHMGEVMIEA